MFPQNASGKTSRAVFTTNFVPTNETKTTAQNVVQQMEVTSRELKARRECNKRKRDKDLFADLAQMMKLPKGTARADVLEQTIIKVTELKCALLGTTIGLPFEDIIRPRLDFPENVFDN